MSKIAGPGQEENRLRKEEEDNALKAEEDRKKREQDDAKKVQQEEELRKQEEELKKKEDTERLKKAEEERLKKLQEEEDKAKKLKEDRQKFIDKYNITPEEAAVLNPEARVMLYRITSGAGADAEMPPDFRMSDSIESAACALLKRKNLLFFPIT